MCASRYFLGALVVSLVIPGNSLASLHFSDNFEAGLSQWVGKSGGGHQGIVVADPLQPGNQVLTFTGVNTGGDVFSSEIDVIPGLTCVLRFDYLGLAKPGSVAGDFGGTVGFAEEWIAVYPVGHRWLAGTSTLDGVEDDPLIDDGNWHTYTIHFDPFAPGPFPTFYAGAPTNPTSNTIRIVLEDFEWCGPVAGDAFFDNISLTQVPEPSALAIWPLLGALGLTVNSWRKRRGK